MVDLNEDKRYIKDVLDIHIEKIKDRKYNLVIKFLDNTDTPQELRWEGYESFVNSFDLEFSEETIYTQAHVMRYSEEMGIDIPNLQTIREDVHSKEIKLIARLKEGK